MNNLLSFQDCQNLENCKNAENTFKNYSDSDGEKFTVEDAFKLLEDSELNIIGYTKDEKITAQFNGDSYKRKLSAFSKDFFMLRLGIDDAKIVKQCRTAIRVLAQEAGIIDTENPIGVGIHDMGENILLVSGEKGAVLDATDGISVLEKPKYKNQLINPEIKKEWVSAESLEIMPRSIATLKNIFYEVLEIVRRWPWEHDNMALFITAFILLSPFQKILRWRPFLYVNGPNGTGKSTFLENVVEGVWGELVNVLDATTRAAIPRTLDNESVLPLIDEFKENVHCEEIFKLLKLTGRGGNYTVARGSKTKKYKICHLFWIASVYRPIGIIKDAALKSRMINFNLTRPDVLRLSNKPSKEQQLHMATTAISGISSNWKRIEKRAFNIFDDYEKYSKQTDGKISTRLLENFMYAMAIIELVNDTKVDYPEWAIPDELKDDGDIILDTILTSKLNGRYTIAEHLDKILNSKIIDHLPEVNRVGIQILKDNSTSKSFIAFDTKVLQKTVLKSEYKKCDITAPLSNIPGAIASQDVKILNRISKCVVIPWDYLRIS